MPPPPLGLGRGIRGGMMMRDVKFSEDFDDPLLPLRILPTMFVWRGRVFCEKEKSKYLSFVVSFNSLLGVGVNDKRGGGSGCSLRTSGSRRFVNMKNVQLSPP